jgi:hypothetical protein
VVERINNTFRRADEIQWSKGLNPGQAGYIDYFAPIVADAEAGFGGVLNGFELMKAMIRAGAAGVHFEDQLASVKKCGHMGGKVLVPTTEAVQKLIGARMAADIGVFRNDPVGAFEPCEKVSTRVSAFSLVRYRTNDYSVPTRHGHREVLVKGFVDEVVIICGADVIARHPRSYAKADLIFDPLHYLELLERKANALDQAAPLENWGLPEEFATFRRLLESRMGTRGRREYIQVLRLIEIFALGDVAAAITTALSLSAISFDAVKQLVAARVERRTVKLDLEAYPHLPRAEVKATRAADYLALTTARNIEMAA